MQTLVDRHNRTRFLLSALLILVLATLFWTGSRYPALDEKAMMSGAIQLEDPLSFEAAFPLEASMGTVERIFWTTLNWINTNKKGMTFGILFAAAFLTAASFLKTRSFRGGFSNSFLGLLIGTPLGVCVNCAAPIARGMYSAGLRAETTLSAMIASPTLNIIVLTMVFSLLPFYMAVLKIVLSLLMILIAVPLICRLLPQTELPADQVICDLPSQQPMRVGATDTFAGAGLSVVRSFLGNLWYIVKMTVPLMILAGFLGAVVATLIPQDAVVGLRYGVVALILIAVVGVFLPVPIAFDVVVTGALLSAGLAPGYVMALLFTLGTFSVYSFVIVVQSVGARAAWYISGAVVALGIIGGAGVQAYHEWQQDRALELLLGQGPTWGAAYASDIAAPQVVSADANQITVTSKPLSPLSLPADKPFTRLEAREIGIDKPLEFSFRDMWPPFWEGRSLSSGDIDRDGDLDLVIASTEAGLYLYENDGSGQFTRASPGEMPFSDLHVFNAALVDLDNDGYLDLFVTTYLQGNFIWRNVGGAFGPEPPQRVATARNNVLALALSFADPDRDGDLDVALGKWAAGWYRRIPGEESRNRLLWNEDGKITGQAFTDLPGLPGETLSILFSDINFDGMTDLIIGNDFDIPDYFYVGDGAGGFDMIVHDSGLIPHTTTTTMAVKTADLQNDGEPEIYLAQISGRSSGVSDTLKMQPLEQYCDVIQDPAALETCQRNMAIKAWYKAGNNFNPSYASKCLELAGRDQMECRAMLVKDLAIQKEDPGICKLIPEGQDIPRAYCLMHFQPPRQPTQAEIELTHPQILRSNVLLEWGGKAWSDQAAPRGLSVGGWSWDTKIADFDSDGHLDVYIVNGTWVPNEVSPSNLFFHNDGQGGFVEASGPFGLEDYLMTAAATAFDFDNDGDLDMVTHPVNGPITVFRNNSQRQGLVFRLIDAAGNRDGIGAVLTLRHQADRIQTREVQMGGGFMSFDAPRVHFGIGDASHATDLTVRWPDGAETLMKGPFHPGEMYDIRRSAAD